VFASSTSANELTSHHTPSYTSLTLATATMAARRAAEEAGRDGTRAARAASFTGMPLQEAQQILNLKDIDDLDAIRKVKQSLKCSHEQFYIFILFLQNYEHLFKVNDKASGGSFYLQSKVHNSIQLISCRIALDLASTLSPYFYTVFSL